MMTLARAGRRGAIAGAASAGMDEQCHMANAAPHWRMLRRLNCKLPNMIEGLRMAATQGGFGTAPMASGWDCAASRPPGAEAYTPGRRRASTFPRAGHPRSPQG